MRHRGPRAVRSTHPTILPLGAADARRPRFAPRVDQLEPRDTPARFGVPWADPQHLTLSFAPDGTTAAGVGAGGPASNLFAKLDAAMPRATWQGAILRAAQTWTERANVSNGNGTFAVQATGLEGKGRRNLVRVTGPAAGNYALDVSFGTPAVAPTGFAAGSLARAGSAAGGAVRAEVRRAADGVRVFGLTAAAGDTVTGITPLLPSGEYRVTFTRVDGPTTASAPLAFELSGDGLSDPVGPVAGKGTLAAQYAAPDQTAGRHQYPVGAVTADPFKWVFRYIF